MNKTEFVNQLSAGLMGLSQEDIKRSVDFYAEMIDDRIEDGMPEEEAVAALQQCYRNAGKVPPELKDAAEELGLTMPLARRAMAILVEQGKAYKVTGDLYFDIDVANDIKQTVAEACSKEGGAGVGELREAMGISRKRAVAMLEVFDKEEFTVRMDDRRFLR